MSPFRYRDDDSSTGTSVAMVLVGAIAGFAVGMFVAQRVGGFSGLTSRLRRRAAERTEPALDAEVDDYDEIEEEEEDDLANVGAGLQADGVVDDDEIPSLEERVLEAFNNDPILSERAIDIGSIGRGIIELAGWVDSDDEAEHAITVARGVPEVETVVNRLLVDDEEQQIGQNVRRFREGDPALREARWEGQQVGTGKRRQGTSDEPDRHADPKPKLEDRWLSEREALRNAADEVEGIAERRGAKRGARGPTPKNTTPKDGLETQPEA